MTEKNPIVIFHKADFDGIASAAILRSKFPNAEFMPYDYGDKLELPDENAPVIMVDVSLPMNSMRDVGIWAEGFTWIDHHKSAIENYEKNYVCGREVTPLIEPVLEIGKAACELTWRYCYPDKDMPMAIWLLGRYDVWDMSDKDEWNNRILPFQYGMRSISNDLKSFPKGLLNNNPETFSYIEQIIETGKQIMAYQDMQNEKMATATAFETLWKRFRVIAMNVSHANSRMFDSVYDPEKHDLMMPFSFNGECWKVSLYTTHDDIDCGDIARTYRKGGGHKAAAGFNVEKFDQIGFQL